jgi:NTP pyrophosphatase (non-canonical NTP hydrolase)
MSSLQQTGPVLVEVLAERKAQEQKWGQQNHPVANYYLILLEEVGEVAKAVLEENFGQGILKDARAELIQVAAVAVAMIESIDRNGV